MEGQSFDEMNQNAGTQPDAPEDVTTVADEISGENVQMGSGFAGKISAEQDVNMTQSGALMISAGQNLDLSYGGGMMINAGHDMDMVNGGGWMVNVGGNADITNGGGLIMNVGGNANITNGGALAVSSQQVGVQKGYVGVILSRQTNLDDSSKVLLDTKQAVAFGAAMGAVFALLSWLLRRK